MEVLLDHADWNDHYSTIDEYVSLNHPVEGSEFTLVKATVYTATTYRMLDGKPTATTVHVGASLDPTP